MTSVSISPTRSSGAAAIRRPSSCTGRATSWPGPRASGGADPALVARLGEAWEGVPEKAARAFAEAIELREVLWRTMSAVAEGAAPAREDVAALNKALASSPARRELEAAGEGFAWSLGAEGATAPLLLAPVLWSAGDLLVGPRRSRVRRCGNERCLFLFLDDSKSGNRRWCSMQSCGNRAKAHRHYLRRRERLRHRDSGGNAG